MYLEYIILVNFALWANTSGLFFLLDALFCLVDGFSCLYLLNNALGGFSLKCLAPADQKAGGKSTQSLRV